MRTDRLLSIGTFGLLAAVVAIQGYGVYSNRRPAPKPPVTDAADGTVFEILGRPSHGQEGAKVALVEFSDFECPYCAKFARETSPAIDKQFVDTGKVRRVFVNNPLAMHKDARGLAEWAMCGGGGSLFWYRYSRLFAETRMIENPICTTDGVKDLVDDDIKLAKTLGFSGTPAFVVGRLAANGQVTAVKLIAGNVPVDIFAKTINEVLEGKLK